jgi:two-component system response regulator NreC
MQRTTVLLVDDHTIVRQGLRRLLETDPDLTVVGETGDGNAAVELALRLRPDVIVMDLALPGVDGIEATKAIVAADKRARVLVLTMNGDDAAIRRSLRAGARGYVLKDAPDILEAVKLVARGQTVLSPLAARVARGRVEETGTPEVEDNLGLLTAREREVLRLIADGKTNKQTAVLLGVSINTIETHRKHIMEKLDLHNTAEIVRFAVRKRVVAG